MKSLIVMSLFGTFTAAIASAEMRDAATHEQLALRYRQTLQQDSTRKLLPAKGSDPSTASQPLSLLRESDIICFNGVATLVPKRAVLQIPKDLAERLKYQPGTRIECWADFYARNRGWITTVEVSRLQAEGNNPLAAETRRQIVKSGNLIVATYQGGPISVLPLKVPADKTVTTNP